MATMSAVQSPRFERTELHYFVGDTFTLELHIDLKNDGESIPIGPLDKVSLVFLKSGMILTTKTYENIQNNTILVYWDEETTALFKKGNYTARVIYEDTDYRRTILTKFGVCVE